MIFTEGLNNLFVYQGINKGFSSTFAVSVFPGTQPTAAAFLSNWASTHMNTHLVHWTGAAWLQQNVDTYGAGNRLELLSSLAAVAAARSGTATWGVLWASNAAESALSSTTIPNASHIIVPVTVVGGTGVIRLGATTIVAGTSYPLTDVSLTVNLV